MNNDLQKAIIIALSVISLSVGYYFVYHLPRQEKREVIQQEQKDTLANMQRCEQMASERSMQETKDWDEGDGSAFNPEYKFDTETNRCLYMSGYLTGNGIFSQYIIDLYTNKQIAGYTKSATYTDGNEFDFKTKKSELFGE